MSKRVLVIEPSRTIRTLMSITLQNVGHRVLVCPTSQEALKVLADLADVPDIIFLAVHLEKHDDYAVIRSVKEHTPYIHTTLVVMVLEEEQATVRHHLRKIPIHVLVKPFRIEDVLTLVSAPVPVIGDSKTPTLESTRKHNPTKAALSTQTTSSQ